MSDIDVRLTQGNVIVYVCAANGEVVQCSSITSIDACLTASAKCKYPYGSFVAVTNVTGCVRLGIMSPAPVHASMASFITYNYSNTPRLVIANIEPAITAPGADMPCPTCERKVSVGDVKCWWCEREL